MTKTPESDREWTINAIEAEERVEFGAPLAPGEKPKDAEERPSEPGRAE